MYLFLVRFAPLKRDHLSSRGSLDLIMKQKYKKTFCSLQTS